jgi:hypothetical protein
MPLLNNGFRTVLCVFVFIFILGSVFAMKGLGIVRPLSFYQRILFLTNKGVANLPLFMVFEEVMNKGNGGEILRNPGTW